MDELPAPLGIEESPSRYHKSVWPEPDEGHAQSVGRSDRAGDIKAALDLFGRA